MKRLACAVTGLALLAVGVAVAADPSIKEIMTRAHKGSDSLLANLGKELKEDEPNRADVQKQSKELAELGAQLQKATPKKGDKASWDQLTSAYEDNAKALEAAAEKKDKAGAAAAQKKLQGSCMACHKAHRGK